ncbi:MAG: hypothetical protein [Bacteriophage sp.]|nr:MAG: hypothetical protein [Bacteriophage sp.]
MINTIVVLLVLMAWALVWYAPFWGWLLIACAASWGLVIELVFDFPEVWDFMTWVSLTCLLISCIKMWGGYGKFFSSNRQAEEEDK